MIYYYPERIYEIIKHDTDIKDYIHQLEKVHDNCHTIEEYILADTRVDGLNDNTKELIDKIDTVSLDILKRYPILEEQFHINNGDYNLDQMIDKLENPDDKIDLENTFYLMSNIINQAEDHSIKGHYMEEYVKKYESLTDEEKKTLSKYIPLKYMYSKVYVYARNFKDFSDGWEDTVINELDAIYRSTINTTADKDITTNYMIESIRNGCGNIESNIEDHNDPSVLITNSFFDKLDTLILNFGDFQYRLYSWGYLNLLDFKASMYAMTGKIDKFKETAKEIVWRINFAFRDTPVLLRALTYYDKGNHNMFSFIVRKWIRMTTAIPFFRDDKDYEIYTISEADREYVLSDRIGKVVSVDNPNLINETSTIENIDRFTIYLVRLFVQGIV